MAAREANLIQFQTSKIEAYNVLQNIGYNSVA